MSCNRSADGQHRMSESGWCTECGRLLSLDTWRCRRRKLGLTTPDAAERLRIINERWGGLLKRLAEGPRGDRQTAEIGTQPTETTPEQGDRHEVTLAGTWEEIERMARRLAKDLQDARTRLGVDE